MNHYGARAKKHWETYLPIQFRDLPDPESFFTKLGEQISAQVRALTLELAGQDPAGEPYMDKVGRLNMSRLQAESQVMQELALIAPEDTTPSRKTEPTP